MGLMMAEIDWSQDANSGQGVDEPWRMMSDAPVGILIVGVDGGVRWANPCAANLAGGTPIGRPLSTVMDGAGTSLVARVLARGRRATDEDQIDPVAVSFGDARTPCELHIGPFDAAGGLTLYLLDLTRHRQLELQYNQSQKMQAIGQLAGGVAHDFNNLLTAILGYCDLLLDRHAPGDPSFPDIVQVKQNANRAANLVRQLLAFSRQQTLKPSVINIDEVVDDISKLLRRLIGEQIEMSMKVGETLYPIRADRGQLEQVIINLAVNARDAMPEGGRLSVRVDNVSLANTLGHRFGPVPAGDYVRLTVEDNGTGIEPEHLDKIFEPFFTTKPLGRGTGLGLATVYGIIEQTGGTILAASVPGQGTTFSIYLPPSEGEIEEEAEDNDPIEPLSPREAGEATILLVEDEAAVRKLACRALEKRGFKVLEAEDGEDAIEILNAVRTVDLVITDVVMPNMDGPTLVRQIERDFGKVRTIYISGYAEDDLRRSMGLEAQDGPAFLSKPFTLKALARAVEAQLGPAKAD